MRRTLPDGYELDDDPGRVDRAAVHAYLGGESYWAQGRTRAVMDMFRLYARLGFGEPGERLMERGRPS